jgi:ornithine cyclodeaminase/alanine dehydrogenase-like protein (mu-crystallin family)
MALLINNDVTERLLSMEEVVPLMKDTFSQLGNGDATFEMRTDIWSPTAHDQGDFYRWGGLTGAIRDPPRLTFRFKSDVLRWFEDDSGSQIEKTHNGRPGRFMGIIFLFDTSNGELLAMLNDSIIQHFRVGATVGVACDQLARADAETVGILGSGGMARAYTEAFAEVRNLSHVKVYSPTPKNRKQFAVDMREKLGVETTAVSSPETAMRDVDIAATATDSTETIYTHEWVEDGQFIVNCRQNEMDNETFEMVDEMYATTNEMPSDNVVGSKKERDKHYNQKRRYWDRPAFPTLGETVVSNDLGRQNETDSIFYYNNSAGLQFTLVANHLYEQALEAGLGTAIPLDWFQQDLRN